MARVISVERENFPIAGTFTISRGSKTEAEVVTCTIRQGDNAGRGECVPYRRYGETLESVIAAIEAMRGAVEGGIGRAALLDAMPAGAARNAIDCALWDLDAKASGIAVSERLHLTPKALETAYTLSLGTAEAMAAQARENAGRPLLKVKIGGGDGDIERIRAVRQAAPALPPPPNSASRWSSSRCRPERTAFLPASPIRCRSAPTRACTRRRTSRR